MNTHKSSLILAFVKSEETQPVKKSTIVQKFEHWYYNGYGANRYIGEILHRMVKRGELEKPNHGYYQANTKKKPPAPNQIQIF